jgi:predicted phosphodiesterase
MQKHLRSCPALLTAVALLATCGAAFEPPREEADEFHFVVLGDAQFHDAAKFNRVIDQTRRLRPAFVIQVGDLIEGYNNDLDTIASEWRRFADQVAPLAPVRFLAVPGNHDVYNGNRQIDPRLEKLFEEAWGPLYYAFTYKNALLIILNSDSTEGANQITGKQLDWLQHTLAENNAEHKFVFMHRPPMLMPDAGQLHELFKQHGVSHVFYGHHHHYHFFEQDGIAYTMTNAAANSAHDHHGVGGFHHLLQVSVRGEEVDVAVIEADAIKPQDAVSPQDNYDFFDLTRRLAPAQVPLQATTGNSYTMAIPLFNASRRDIEVLISCSSADQRWQIEPKVIPPLELATGTRQTLTLSASFNAARVPESQPVCELRAPFKTSHGEWLDFEHRVTGVR